MKRFTNSGIYNYEDIIIAETMYNKSPVLNSYTHALLQGSYFQAVASYILEIAKNSTVLRCYCKDGDLTEDALAWESDAAHTNLVMALIDSWLDFIKEVKNLNPPYPSRSIREAIRIRNLPENETGDIPDNGERDESSKLLRESIYYNNLGKWCYPSSKTLMYIEARKILSEMVGKNSMLGRGMYLADKIAAIIMTLCYDSIDQYPLAYSGDNTVAKMARDNMEICDCHIEVRVNTTAVSSKALTSIAASNPLYYIRTDDDGNAIGIIKIGYRLSELWTIDYFRNRKMYQYDDTGFFTALLVMITLMVNDGWYDWRQDDYQDSH